MEAETGERLHLLSVNGEAESEGQEHPGDAEHPFHRSTFCSAKSPGLLHGTRLFSEGHWKKSPTNVCSPSSSPNAMRIRGSFVTLSVSMP